MEENNQNQQSPTSQTSPQPPTKYHFSLLFVLVLICSVLIVQAGGFYLGAKYHCVFDKGATPLCWPLPPIPPPIPPPPLSDINTEKDTNFPSLPNPPGSNEQQIASVASVITFISPARWKEESTPNGTRIAFYSPDFSRHEEGFPASGCVIGIDHRLVENRGDIGQMTLPSPDQSDNSLSDIRNFTLDGHKASSYVINQEGRFQNIDILVDNDTYLMLSLHAPQQSQLPSCQKVFDQFVQSITFK